MDYFINLYYKPLKLLLITKINKYKTYSIFFIIIINVFALCVQLIACSDDAHEF